MRRGSRRLPGSGFCLGLGIRGLTEVWALMCDSVVLGRYVRESTGPTQNAETLNQTKPGARNPYTLKHVSYGPYILKTGTFGIPVADPGTLRKMPGFRV